MAIKASATITLSSIRDIQSVTWYYLLQSSTSQAPAKPTTSPPGGNWTDTEPGYTAGSTNSLYTVERTVFTDGTFAYSNVCLDSSYEAAKQAYNKASTAQSAATTAQSAATTAQSTADLAISSSEVIAGTQGFATNIWEGVAPFASLKNGQSILFWLPYASAANKWYSGTAITGTSTTATVFSGSGIASAVVNNLYLNTSTNNVYRCTTAGNAATAKWVYLTNVSGAASVANNYACLNLRLSTGSMTGAKNIYIDGTTRCTTHISVGNVVQMVYRENVSINNTSYTGWWISRARNDNNYDRIRFNNNIKAKTAITASFLIVGDSSGFYHLTAGSAFDVDKPILWAVSAIAANATGTNNYLGFPGCTMRNNTGNSSWTATQYQTLYLAGTLAGNRFTVASSNWLTTAPSNASLTYISLGYMYTNYQIYLYPEHPMYRIVGGVLKAVSQIAVEAQATATAAQTSADAANALMDSDVLKVTSNSVKMADPSTGVYWKIQSGAAGFYDGQNRMFAGIGADDSGGYLAANRLKSPDASVDAHIDATFEHDNVQLTFTVPKYSGSSATPSGTTPSMNIGSFTGSDYDGTEYSNSMHNYIGALGSFELQCYDKLGSSGLDEHGRISINQESVPGLFLYSNEENTTRDAWLHGHVCTTNNYTNWECKGSIIPESNNLYNLGINAARWKDIYSNNSFHGSDRRFKKDITDIKDAEAFVMGLRPRQYRLRDDDEKVHLGFVAQEVADVMPEGFGGYDDSDPDALCLSYSEFIAPLVAIIQAQQQTIKDLSHTITNLTRRIEALERGETSCQ